MALFSSNSDSGGLSVSNVFPATTEDERDPREDQNEDRRREEEIKGDKPPHHG
jgi:hypothetical protein